MKHGPIALVDRDMPTVVIATKDNKTYKKVLGNIEEVKARGGEIIAVATDGDEEIKQKAEQDAKPEAEALVARARNEIQQERDEAITELRKEFTDLTISAAEKVIEQELDKEAHRKLIDKVLEESDTLRSKN